MEHGSTSGGTGISWPNLMTAMDGFIRTVPLRSVGAYVLDKYPPHWAY